MNGLRQVQFGTPSASLPLLHSASVHQSRCHVLCLSTSMSAVPPLADTAGVGLNVPIDDSNDTDSPTTPKGGRTAKPEREAGRSPRQPSKARKARPDGTEQPRPARQPQKAKRETPTPLTGTLLWLDNPPTSLVVSLSACLLFPSDHFTTILPNHTLIFLLSF